MSMTRSLCYTAEFATTVYVDYTLIKNKLKNKQLYVMFEHGKNQYS